MDRSEAQKTNRTIANDEKLQAILNRIKPPVATMLQEQEDYVIAHAKNPQHFEMLCDRIADANSNMTGLSWEDRRLIIRILTETTDMLEKVEGKMMI
jgi:hypothetical protein